MTSLLYRLFTDEDGQDLVEYTLLTATLAFAGVAAFVAISAAINTVYTSWDTTTQAIWEPQAPAGS
jgi:Flp pilus assembly pilin Flp